METAVWGVNALFWMALAVLLALVSFAAAQDVSSNASAPRRLNNLVTEHLNTWGALASAYRIDLPREGWVFVAFDAEQNFAMPIDLTLESGSTLLRLPAGQTRAQAMRWLPSGEHVLQVEAGNQSVAGRLIVRRIPQILAYMVETQEEPAGDAWFQHSWNFLDNALLPYCNIVVSPDNEAYDPFIRAWQERGRVWLVNSAIADIRAKSPRWIHHYWNAWTRDASFDGVIHDEVVAAPDRAYMANYGRALERMAGDPSMRGKRIYFFSGWTDHVANYRPLVESLYGKQAYIVPEMYFHEQPSEAELRTTLARWGVAKMAEWRKLFPRGLERHLLITLATNNNSMRYSNDKFPHINYKVHLDIQFHMVVNDPAFDGLEGIANWTLHYLDEELVRFYGQLLRHYCIEGRTERMTDDPYVMDYLDNPGFEDGTTGWQVKPAADGSVRVMPAAELKCKKTDYQALPERSRVLVTKSVSEGPNRLAQPLRNLVPGQLYSLTYWNHDLQSPKSPAVIQTRATVRGGSMLSDKSWDRAWKSGADGSYWTCHYAVFEAQEPSAELILSDESARDDGGHAVKVADIVWDFIQVQPYFAQGAITEPR